MLIQSKAIIRQSRDFVWRIFINPKTWKEWYGDALQEITPGWQEDGYLNWKMDSPSRIAEFVPLEKVTLIGLSSGMKTEFTFADAEDGATLVMLQQNYGSSASAVTDQVTKRMRTDATVASLKRYAESYAGQAAASENKTASRDIQQEEKKHQKSKVKNKSTKPSVLSTYLTLFFICSIMAGIAYFIVSQIIGSGIITFPPAYAHDVQAACIEPNSISENTTNRSFGNVVISKVIKDESNSKYDSWSYLPPEDFGLQEAKSIDEINTVICIDEKQQQIDVCHYDQGAVQYRVRRNWNINVIDWGTKESIASTTLSGPSPNPCPETLLPGYDSVEAFGDEPRGEFINWVSEFDKR